MHKLKVLVAFCFCMSFLARAQVTITPTSGCLPLLVNFNAPPGAASWNFGVPGPPVTSANTSNLYTSPGTYIATYSGIGGNVTQTIVVYSNNLNAAFSFTVAPSGCLPRIASFTATGGSATSNYNWTMDDGGTATGSIVTYPYTTDGSFYPTLTISDPASSCQSTVVSATAIHVSAQATMDISATPGFGSCQSPFTIALTGSNSATGSPLGGGLNYSWNLGNSQTSNLSTPGSVTYNQGVFTISLSVTDNNNCVTSATRQVSVVQPTIAVTTTTTHCIYGQGALLQTLTVQASHNPVTVDMGDGSPPFLLSNPNPTAPVTFTWFAYTSPGTFTRTFTVADGTCVAVVINTTIVEQVVPQFTTTAPNYTCAPIMIKNYINQSTVNTNASLTYEWVVTGWDGYTDPVNSATLTNPTFTFQYGSLNPYAHYGTYSPKVKLMVTSSNSCSATMIHILDSLHRPTAWFNKNKKQGCAPLSVRFRDSTDTYSVIYPVQSYTWNNGANPPSFVYGVSPPPNVNPTFTYNSPGTYTPYLIVQTLTGCLDTSYIDTVIVVTPPSASIVYTPNLSVCAGVPVMVNLQATPATSLITHWHVESDEGYFSGCVNDSMPTWPFTHPGVHNFTLSAFHHECGSTQLSAQTITVNGPVAKVRYRTNCTNKKSVDFFAYLDQAQSATIDYGDFTFEPLPGNTAGTMSYTRTHVYAATGDYTVRINSVNGGCAYSHSVLVTVREIQVGFTMPPVICNNTPILLDASTSVDVFTGCGRGYAWFIDTLPTRQVSGPTLLSDTIRGVGTHTVHLWVKDINSCTDTLTQNFRVSSPLPDFGFNQNPLCLSSNTAQIINLTPQLPDAVNDYTLDLGQGLPRLNYTITDFPISNVYNAGVPFSTYTLELIAKNEIGCLDSIEHVLKVNNPSSSMLLLDGALCMNEPSLLVVTPGYTNVVNYGNGQTITYTTGVATYTYNYPVAGNYTMVVAAVDGDGCATFPFSFPVSVQNYPVANFNISVFGSPMTPDPVFCEKTISFTSTTLPATQTYTYVWNLDGSNELNQPVVVDDFSPGVHTVTLTAITSNGCPSTITHTFAISMPEAAPVIDKPRFCFGETIRLSIIDSTQVGSWQWVFGDGVPTQSILASSAPSPSYAYTYSSFIGPSGVGEIYLIYKGTGGYCSKITSIPIQMVKIDPDFNRNLELTQSDFEHCLNIKDEFTNKTKFNNGTFLGPLSFMWNFGNGATSTVQSVSYTYPDPGVYSVTLSVSDFLSGCSNKTVKNMTVNPLPTVTVSATDSVCKNSLFQLNSVGSPEITEYEWMPATNVSNPNAATTQATLSSSSSFSLNVTNRFGCKGASNNVAYVYVQQPPNTYNWDTTIVVGQATNLNSYQGEGYTYTWSPAADLSCSVCAYPITGSTVTTTYSVEIMDPMKCFKIVNVYTVNVDPLTTVDVPTAFTPNGDGVNDVIYVDGWGIKKLNYFRIFNRWGQLLFESFDIKTGWDGTYKGVPQNMETYIYQASVETYIPGKALEKSSSFRLIR